MRRITTLAFSTAMLAAAGWIAGAHAQATPPAPAAPPANSAPAQSAAPDTSAPADTSTPAAAPKATKHHHMMHKSSKAPKAEAGDAAVEDLNAKSLDDAKAGKSFAPPTPTPAAEIEADGQADASSSHDEEARDAAGQFIRACAGFLHPEVAVKARGLCPWTSEDTPPLS